MSLWLWSCTCSHFLLHYLLYRDYNLLNKQFSIQMTRYFILNICEFWKREKSPSIFDMIFTFIWYCSAWPLLEGAIERKITFQFDIFFAHMPNYMVWNCTLFEIIYFLVFENCFHFKRQTKQNETKPKRMNLLLLCTKYVNDTCDDGMNVTIFANSCMRHDSFSSSLYVWNVKNAFNRSHSSCNLDAIFLSSKFKTVKIVLFIHIDALHGNDWGRDRDGDEESKWFYQMWDSRSICTFHWDM